MGLGNEIYNVLSNERVSGIEDHRGAEEGLHVCGD